VVYTNDSTVESVLSHKIAARLANDRARLIGAVDESERKRRNDPGEYHYDSDQQNISNDW